MAKFKGSTFQAGDVVEITAEAAATGMLDFIEGKGYCVESVVADPTKYNPLHTLITVRDESGCLVYYDETHFKLKENAVESNENHFKVGQTVWDVLYGKGVVTDVKSACQNYPVRVKFPDGTRSYTVEGKLDEEFARTLFFSEPKIIAETKPAFVPTFKEGDVLFTYGKHKDVTGDMGRIVVSSETERVVFDENDIGWLKTHWEFYKLGEKIEFN